jgi:GNAT superfamily N-acetyltransferase
MKTRVRTAAPEEVTLIADCQVRMAWETENLHLDRRTVERGAQAIFDDPRKGQYWVAEVDGTIAGCLLTIPEWSDWRCGTVLWIHSLYVMPDFRRQGIFTSLYQTLRALVQDSPEYKGLRLYVDRRNERAQNTYQAVGMDGQHYALYEWLDESS